MSVSGVRTEDTLATNIHDDE